MLKRRNSVPARILAAAALLALAAVAPSAAQTAPPPSVAQNVKAAAQAVSEAAATAAGAPAATQPPTAVEAAPAEVSVSTTPGGDFKYDPVGRRDPFKSLLQLEAKKKDLSQLPPIQQFDLESVRVVGIIADAVKGPQAMIRAPNGQTFIVRKGTIVGKNEGEVADISLKGILVVEKFVDFMNRETRKETLLKSHPTAGR